MPTPTSEQGMEKSARTAGSVAARVESIPFGSILFIDLLLLSASAMLRGFANCAAFLVVTSGLVYKGFLRLEQLIKNAVQTADTAEYRRDLVSIGSNFRFRPALAMILHQKVVAADRIEPVGHVFKHGWRGKIRIG
jgi:hypothetical protein